MAGKNSGLSFIDQAFLRGRCLRWMRREFPINLFPVQ